MPTARPSISASTGAVAVSCTAPLSANSPAMPTPRPMSALSRVIPAATSEPKVTMSTIAATATPSASVEPISGSPDMISPPCSTRRPALSAAPPAFSYAARWASVTSSLRPANCTWISA